MSEFVADPTALREAIGKHTPVWEHNDLGFRLDCGCDNFTHGGVDRETAEQRFADHLATALLASGVVQPREDAVREAKAEALREAATYWRRHSTGDGSRVVVDEVEGDPFSGDVMTTSVWLDHRATALTRPTDDGTPGATWRAGRLMDPGVTENLCVHNVGLTGGLWCGACDKAANDLLLGGAT